MSYRRTASRRRTALGAAFVLACGASACSARGAGSVGAGIDGTAVTPVPASPRVLPSNRPFDVTSLYLAAGMFATSDPFPFIGSVHYLAGRAPDSTLVLLSLSLANRELTFTGEGSNLRASYLVAADVRAAALPGTRSASDTLVKHVLAPELVRVSSARETARSEETIVFQHYLTLAPGRYTIAVTVRDGASARSGAIERAIEVPRFTRSAPQLAPPVLVYHARPRATTDSMPALIGNPRSTVVFGRDSAADIYLEAYGLNGARDARVALQISDENGARIWRDTVPLAGSGAVHNADVHSAIVTVPLMKIGVGRESLSASLVGVPNVGATMTSPVFVSLGEEWALVSFDEMLHYLRWFTTSARLDSLRAAPPERRAAAWSAFLKATDPVPATPEHEGLRTYFARLQTANERFREESPQGWATDRGRVYITLGEPEQMVVQAENTVTRRGRVQVWSYPQYNLRIVFLDQTGFGHWQLSPESEAELESVAQRERERE